MRLKNFFAGAMFIIFSSCIGQVLATPPTNIMCAKEAIATYYDSGAFERDVDAVVKKAENYLDDRLSKQKSSEKLAIVLDIDDTSLSNYQSIKNRDYTNKPEEIDAGYRKADSPAITPVLKLYKKAIANNVHVFFITFRPQAFKLATEENLKKVGYTQWDGIFLPSDKDLKGHSKEFKTAVRAGLEKQGYSIVLSLGDQDGDLEGGHAEHVGKIPNPLYTWSTKHCVTKVCR